MAAAHVNTIDAENEWEDVPASQQTFDEDVDEEIYSQEDDPNYGTASPEPQPSSSKSKAKMLRIVSDDEDATTGETDAKKRKLTPLPPSKPSTPSNKGKQPVNNNGARGKKQKQIDDGKKN